MKTEFHMFFMHCSNLAKIRKVCIDANNSALLQRIGDEINNLIIMSH